MTNNLIYYIECSYNKYLCMKKNGWFKDLPWHWWYKNIMFVDTFEDKRCMYASNIDNVKKIKEKLKVLFPYDNIFKVYEHKDEFSHLMRGSESHQSFIKFLCCLSKNKKLPSLPKDVKKIIYSYVFNPGD